jgi:alkyl hydroperoxide reductase 1
MSTLKVGDSFPEGVVFSYVPYTPETSDITACGICINYDASKGAILPLSLKASSSSYL